MNSAKEQAKNMIPEGWDTVSTGTVQKVIVHL